MEGETERVETSRESICVDRLDGPDVGRKVLEAFCSSSEVENVGICVDLALCVLASPPVVPVVTVPFSDVNLVCEAVYSDSDCEIVEPQTFVSLSLSPENAKRVSLWSVRQKMNH